MVAQLLGVAVKSVSNWIDSDSLKAGRTPGGHRRIAKDDLVNFLVRQKLPIPPELATAQPKVLVVDDELAFGKWLGEEILEAYPDCQVLQAQDGYTAGEMVADAKPDVVIVDLRMPGMDGFEVCRRIKAREETTNTVVIAITAYPSEESREEALAAGAKVCLTKPVDRATLMAELALAIKS